MNMPLIDSLTLRCKEVLNPLDFMLRSWMRFSLPPYQEAPETKSGLWKDKPDPDLWAQRETRLIQDYSLEHFKKRSSRVRYLETLTFLDYLEQLLPNPPSYSELSWLDVGAKNWTYVEALYRFANTLHPQACLTGIELDAYRRYSNLHTRADYAATYIKGLSNTQYLVGDVLDHHGQYHIISCFLPFVFIEPCLYWGLPKRYFRPEAFLSHLLSLLRPNGTLILLNQGAAESQEQGNLLQAAKNCHPHLEIRALGEMKPSFLDYKYPRYGWRVNKPAVVAVSEIIDPDSQGLRPV